jgi:high-affinity iron transporter
MILTLAVIIFREIFEIALIACLVVFATKKQHDIKKIIFFGFLFGISGSVFIGLSVNQISGLFQGFGQEIFNASILLITAGLMITVLLSISNPKVLKNKLAKENSEIGAIFLLAFTVLREGAEIVLLTHSYILANDNIYEVFLGCLIGLISGIIFSLLMYFGLNKMAIKKIFTIINWLIFIVAGLITNAFSFLVAGGIVDGTIKVAFDISGLLSNNSILGSIMSNIFGYSANPSWHYLAVYFSSLFLIILTYLKVNSSKITKPIN